jgi:hypothetical protein
LNPHIQHRYGKGQALAFGDSRATGGAGNFGFEIGNPDIESHIDVEFVQGACFYEGQAIVETHIILIQGNF